MKQSKEPLLSEATKSGTTGRVFYLRLVLAALAVIGIPELTASIGYGGSPVTTAVAMLALGMLAALDFPALLSMAAGGRADVWQVWLREHRDGLEAFLFGAIAAGMFPYISILWPAGSLLAGGVVAYRYPGRAWRHSIAITVAFLSIAFLRVLSDILVDVTSHGLFPFEFVVTFLLSAPFSFFGAAGVSRIAKTRTHS